MYTAIWLKVWRTFGHLTKLIYNDYKGFKCLKNSALNECTVVNDQCLFFKFKFSVLLPYVT